MAFTKIAAAGIGSTELVTLHSLEVLNNATVGGVLTYEDVTNVDSIGIITARAGVLVGSGITLSTDGNIFATGIATVGFLTVTGNNMTVGNNKSIFAENNVRFKSSGDAFIDHNTTGQDINFRVSNSSSLDTTPLVVKTTGINVTGSGTFSGAASVGGDITATSTDAGTTGPTLKLFHNSASPADNDVVSRINFSGDDDAGNETEYARIDTTAIDVSNGTETGYINFHTRGLGSFNPILSLQGRSTASAPSVGSDATNGLIVDVYNTGNPYPRYVNLIAKGGGDTDSNLTFWTEAVGGAPTEKLRITSDGIIEMGTAIGDSAYDGNQRLRVGRTGDCSISVRANGSTTAATGLDFGDDDDDRAGRIQYIHDGDYMSFHTNGAGSGSSNERFRIDSNGDVTVGGVTNGGGNRFLVAESHTEAFVNPTDSILRITNADNSANNNQASISFTCSTTGVGADSAIVSQAEDASGNSRLEFWTDVGNGMTEKMTILSDGGVLINSPTGARAVVGTEYLSVHGGSASNTVAIAGAVSHNNGIPLFLANGSNTTSQRLIRFAAGSGGDTRGTITWNGSNIVYGGSSDYRLKKNVTSLTDGITKLKQLKPITFDWIKETDNNNVMGFLAHEVKEVIPQVVIGEKDEVDSEGKPEYQELDYGGMTPLIVAALQEAVSEIETLKAEVAALKG